MCLVNKDNTCDSKTLRVIRIIDTGRSCKSEEFVIIMSEILWKHIEKLRKTCEKTFEQASTWIELKTKQSEPYILMFEPPYHRIQGTHVGPPLEVSGF